LNILLQFQSKQWHDKLFTLSWQSDVRWVLVRYKNGQSKPWYKSPGRGYRFKRSFVKKGNDQFQNLANLNSPKVVLYFFPYWLSFPKKKVVNFSVQHVAIAPQELVMKESQPNFTLPNVLVSAVTPPTAPVIHLADKLNIQCHSLDVQVLNQEWSIQSSCDWPIAEWSEQWAHLGNDELKNKLTQLTS
jgi:hypothetical protein